MTRSGSGRADQNAMTFSWPNSSLFEGCIRNKYLSAVSFFSYAVFLLTQENMTTAKYLVGSLSFFFGLFPPNRHTFWVVDRSTLPERNVVCQFTPCGWSWAL